MQSCTPPARSVDGRDISHAALRAARGIPPEDYAEEQTATSSESEDEEKPHGNIERVIPLPWAAAPEAPPTVGEEGGVGEAYQRDARPSPGSPTELAAEAFKEQEDEAWRQVMHDNEVWRKRLEIVQNMQGLEAHEAWRALQESRSCGTQFPERDGDVMDRSLATGG